MKRVLLLSLLLLPAMALPGLGQSGVPLRIPGHPELGGMIAGGGERTILVLHGGPAAPHDYSAVSASPLQHLGRTLWYDQRGCGLSAEADSYSWRDHVADLDRVVSHVSPDRPVVLYGGSWGAMLALLYSLEYPSRVEALILRGVPTWTGMETGLTRVDSILSRRMQRRCGLVAQAVWQSLSERPSIEALRAIAIPALFISGSEDAIGADQVSRVLPRAELVLIPGGSHVVDYEQPGRFFAEVRRFLQALP